MMRGGEDRRKNRHRQALQQLGEQIRLVAELEFQQQRHREREKILCEQILHQQLFLELFGRQQPQQGPLAGTPAPAPAPGGAPLHNFDLPHTCALCAHLRPDSQQQEQRRQQDQQRWASLQQRLLPDTYVSRLLLEASPQQAQQVTDMTPEGWLKHFAALFPQLAALVESVERADIVAAAERPTTISRIASAAAVAVAAAAATAGTTGDSASSLTLCRADLTGNGPGSGIAAGTNSSIVSGSSGGGASTPSSGSLLGRMFTSRSWVGLCPALDLQQLLELQATIATLLMLAVGLNHVSLFTAGASCYSSGVEVTDKPLHWQLVVDRLQLSEVQMLHLSIILEEYKRSSTMLQAEGAQLVQQVAAPSLQTQAMQHLRGLSLACGQANGSNKNAAGASATCAGCTNCNSGKHQLQQRQPQQQQQQAGGSPGTTARGVHSHGNEDQQLQRLVLRRQANLFATSAGIVNTLTAWQQSVMICASFPFIPSLMSVAEVAASQLQERRQQQLAAVQRKVLADGLGNYDVPGSELAARAMAAAAAACAASTEGSQKSAGAASMVQAVQAQYQQLRAEQLERHQAWCWESLGCFPPM